MAVHPSSEEIADLLGALGFAKERVAGLTIDCRPHAAAMVTVEVFLEKSDIRSIAGTIKQHYELVPVGDLKKAEALRDRYQAALYDIANDPATAHEAGRAIAQDTIESLDTSNG